MKSGGRAVRTAATLIVVMVLHLVAAAPAAADEWRRHDTEHFRVIYRTEDADAATRVAELAPAVWERTTDFLQYQPSEPIPVVLYGQTARANGFFTPYPPHVALFTAAPAGPWMGARTEDWLESVFVHEVTHYLHLMQPIGFFGTASRVFGPLAAAGGTLFLPGWAVEGPTTTAETVLTSGGRGRNPYFEMEWVAPILSDEMYSYDQAGVGSAYPPRGRIYSAGYILTDHLLQQYGEDAFIELNREFQRWPFLGMRRALRRTTGRSGPAIHQEMVEALAARYAGRRNLPGGQPLSATPTDQPDPLAQRHLVGMTERGAVAFHRSAFDAGSLQLLHEEGTWRYMAAVTPMDEYSVAVSADGRVAAAVAQRGNIAGRGGGAYVSSGDLYLIDLLENGARRVTTGARLFHPAVDGTGSTVIAVERTGRFSRLVEIDPTHGERTPVYAPSERFLSMPALSRDGRFIAVVENDSGRQSIVVLERVEGPSPQYAPVYRVNVGGERDAEYRPRFAAGRELWFVADADGLLQLYRTTVPDSASPIPSITRILTDQVGIVSGVPNGAGDILYGTYRSNGFTVRHGLPIPQEVGRIAPELAASATEVITAEPAPRASSSLSIESRRYWDLPRPVLWVPTVSVAGDASGTTRLDLGAGLIMASNLGRHNLEAFAAYNPTDQIPSGSLEYTYAPGPTSLSLTATAQDIRELTAAVTRPLWYDEGIGHYRGVVARVGGTYEATGDFATSQSTSFTGAARLMRYRYRGSGQLFGGIGGELQSALRYQPEFSNQAPDVATVTTASLHMGRRTGWLHLEPVAAVATSGSGAAMENLPWRTQPFDPEGLNAIAATNGALLGRLAVTAAAPPLDIAWRGVSFQNVGARLYVSQAASSAPTLTIDNYTVAGAELQLHGKFNMIPLQVTSGVAIRLPHGSEAGARRIQFYVNLGGAAVEQVSDRFVTP